MPQQTPYSQYGNKRSFYGNIQLGAAPRFFRVYGAWPEEKPAQKGMLVSDWQEPEVIQPIPHAAYSEEITSRIEIIKQLKEAIAQENDLKNKNQIREHLHIERQAKERAFKLKAMIDEEESLFIILH